MQWKDEMESEKRESAAAGAAQVLAELSSAELIWASGANASVCRLTIECHSLERDAIAEARLRFNELVLISSHKRDDALGAGSRGRSGGGSGGGRHSQEGGAEHGEERSVGRSSEGGWWLCCQREPMRAHSSNHSEVTANVPRFNWLRSGGERGHRGQSGDQTRARQCIEIRCASGRGCEVGMMRRR